MMQFKTIEPEVNMVDLLRNPRMGWVLTADARGAVPDAGEYWRRQDRAARDCASVFLLRVTAAALEPESGLQLWRHDENFQALLSGALGRGLRLAFELSGDGFPAAFGREFDDPERVDFIIGEAETAGCLFGSVPCIRRVAVGGEPFTGEQRRDALAQFPGRPFFAGSCYRNGEQWREDSRYGAVWEDWPGVHAATLAEALEHHANTLELGDAEETARWLSTPDLLQEFIELGGYRLAPVRLEFTANPVPGGELVIRSVWGNFACGVLPDQRYKVEFALLGPRGEILAAAADPVLQPGDWVAGALHSGETVLTLPEELPGEGSYLSVAIRVPGGGAPELRLAACLAEYGCRRLFEKF